MNVVEIYNLAYHMDMCCRGDVWRYQGEVVGHPKFPDGKRCYPSAPISLNEEDLTFETKSGRHYKIMSFDGCEKKIIEQMKADIANGGFEVH